MNIICVSTQNWFEELWTNKQHIMNILSRFNRVLYLNPEYLSFRKFITGGYSFRDIFSRPNRNIFILPSGLSATGFRIRLIDQILNLYWRFFLKIFVLIFLPGKNVLWIYQPEGGVWLNHFNESLSVYDCVDDYSQFPVYREKFGEYRIKRIENHLISRVDIVFATSHKIFKDKQKHNSNTHLITNVAEFDHFNSIKKLNYSEPGDLSNIPHPRLLFIGAISSFKLDFDLLENLAKELPEFSIILLGPKNTGELKTDIKGLESHKNIYFLGKKRYSRLPEYIQHSDILILPYRLNEYIKSCFPIKFFEYLATGKPVITTRISELEKFGSIVQIADSPSDFIRSCRELITSDSSTQTEARIQLASKNTWGDRIDKLVTLINKKDNIEIKYPTTDIMKEKKKVRIGIDARLMFYSRMGIGEYVENLIRILPELDKFNEYFIYLDNTPPNLDLPDNFHLRIIPMGTRQIWLQHKLPKQCMKDRISILHSPVNFEMPLCGDFKKIVTIHDLVPIIYPEYASKKFSFLARILYPRVVNAADLILTDSVNSKCDIERIYSKSRRKVEAVYLGVRDEFTSPASSTSTDSLKTRFGIEKKFILNTGGFEPRKNVLNLIKAFNKFQVSEPDYILVIVGKFSHTYKQAKLLVNELGLSDKVVFTDFVSQEELITLYNECEIFIYPSYYEGFGFPPLEAIASGKPVISSSGGSLKEILKDSALYIDPDDIDSIYHALKTLIPDMELRNKLIENGKTIIKNYNWYETVKITHEHYLKLAG